MQIQTEQLLLREFENRDVMNVFMLLGNEKVTNFINHPHKDIVYSKNYKRRN